MLFSTTTLVSCQLHVKSKLESKELLQCNQTSFSFMMMAMSQKKGLDIVDWKCHEHSVLY